MLVKLHLILGLVYQLGNRFLCSPFVQVFKVLNLQLQLASSFSVFIGGGSLPNKPRKAPEVSNLIVQCCNICLNVWLSSRSV